MKLRTALELGRISNLPTVWSNCLAGALLAGADPDLAALGWIMLALSLMYLGGMFLNDAFDAGWDAQHKPERPIPSGQVSAAQVWVAGSLLLCLGPLTLLGLYLGGAGERFAPALAASMALGLAILAYDYLHKRAAYSPWIMGGCRLLVYLTAGLALGTMNALLLVAACALLAYVVGLTYVARTEHLNHPGNWWPLLLLLTPVLLGAWLATGQPWSMVFVLVLLAWLALRLRELLPGPRRNVPAGVGGLLAGIPLVDASVLAGIGQWYAAGLALAAFAATLVLHRLIAGT